MRPSEFFRSEDESFDFDLLEQLRVRTVAPYSDVEAAIGLAELLGQEFMLYGTSGGQHITDAGSREGMRTLGALGKRLGVDWKPAYRDFPSFYGYWTSHGGYGSWAVRRQMVSELFSPLRERLEELEDDALRDDLVIPVSPRGHTGWAEVDNEVAELRRHFHAATSPQDYRNVGNDLVAVLEARVSVRFGLLAILAEGEAHGYELKTAYERRTGGSWALNIGQVYTTLQRLERDGLVVQLEAVGDGVDYRLTESGRQALDAWFETPVLPAVAPRDELTVKVLLAVAAANLDLTDLIQRQRRASIEQLQAYTRRKAQADPSDLAFLILMDALIFRTEAEIRWLDATESRLRTTRDASTKG